MNQEITGCVIHHTYHSFILLYAAWPFVTTIFSWAHFFPAHAVCAPSTQKQIIFHICHNT